MLKKLKIKFVIIIMSIVTVLFLTTFGLIMHLTKENMERESIQMMKTLAFRPPVPAMMNRPDFIPEEINGIPKENNGIRLPFFTVKIHEDGSTETFGSDIFDLSDEDMISGLVKTVMDSKDDVGLLHNYDLRYMRDNEEGKTSIVFADVSSEKAMLKGLVKNLVIIGLIGYISFFFISLLLAKWVAKPVEKTWNEQKQFIADASHELKTPLTVIMTNAEMLADQSYNETDKSGFAKNILSTSKRMRGLVESLLELARLDNNRTQIKHENLDYSKLINNCLLPFEPLFFENGLDLTADIENGITVSGDKDKLRQMVSILLDNALKYSDSADPVVINLKHQNMTSLFSVSGSGDPLSKEDCKNIFKRFYRTDESRNDSRSYGLGLSIAESIITEHGGKIWAESENRRNTFYVSLPDKCSQVKTDN